MTYSLLAISASTLCDCGHKRADHWGIDDARADCVACSCASFVPIRCPKTSHAWHCRCELLAGHGGDCVNGGDAFHGREP